MINLYKLLNTLEQGMSLFQLNKWKTEGIWYPILQYKKESNEIQVVTNVFVPDQETYHIQLTGKLENTHIERIELQGRMVSAFIFDIPKDPLYFYVIVGVLDQNHNITCVLLRNIKPTQSAFNPQLN